MEVKGPRDGPVSSLSHSIWTVLIFGVLKEYIMHQDNIVENRLIFLDN